MKLIGMLGMLDSPYVRRVAVALECLGISFEHEAVSVFSSIERYGGVHEIPPGGHSCSGDQRFAQF